MKNQKKHMREWLERIDLRSSTRILYSAFSIVVLVLTILICLNAPAHAGRLCLHLKDA